MDEKRFLAACEAVTGTQRENMGIGTLGEKTLHAVIKHYFEPTGKRSEVPLGRFVADILLPERIVEIQTGVFGSLRKKLKEFLETDLVTIVYPIIQTKRLVWLDGETGKLIRKRKSSKSGSVYDVFKELYRIKDFLTHENLTLCLLLVDAEEYRYTSTRNRKGFASCDKIPTALRGEVYITKDGYSRLVPETLSERFTSADFGRCAKITRAAAQTGLNVLHHVGAVKRVGKDGNTYIYER